MIQPPEAQDQVVTRHGHETNRKAARNISFVETGDESVRLTLSL